MHNPIQRFEDRLNGAQMHVPRRVQAIKILAQWKQANHDQPDWWLRLEIGGAFQQLAALSLPGTPAVEVLPATAELWLNLLIDRGITIEQVDRPRVRKGFSELYTTLRQWPQVADLLEKMPPRPHCNRLREPELSEEQRAANAARLADLLKQWEKEENNDRPKKN